MTPAPGRLENQADSGNGLTARRWARLLAPEYRVRLSAAWQAGDETLMIALHARRSAASVATWKAVHPERPLLLVLTGTDLYRDIDEDASAQRSLALADRLVVLPGGRVWFVELKVKGGRLSALQQVFSSDMAALGQNYTVLWSKEDATTFVSIHCS